MHLHSYLQFLIELVCMSENIYTVSLHQPPQVHHWDSQSLSRDQGTWHSLGLFLLPLCAMGWSLATPSPVSLRLVHVEGTPFPCSTQQQAPSHWKVLHQPPPTTAPSLPITFGEVDQWHTGWFQHWMTVRTVFFVCLLVWLVFLLFVCFCFFWW